MISRIIKVINEIGLHARPATFFVQKANLFTKTDIWIEKNDIRVNAKSLLGVLALGIVGEDEIQLIIDGPDEEEAMNVLSYMIETGFTDIKMSPRNDYGF